MVNDSRQIESLSSFKRSTARVVRKLKNSGRPIFLTVKKKVEFVVQDLAAFERLANLAEQCESLSFIRAGLDDADSGRTRPMRDLVKSLGRKRVQPRQKPMRK